MGLKKKIWKRLGEENVAVRQINLVSNELWGRGMSVAREGKN